MDAFLQQWQSASLTSVGFFWMALWAFVLGYFISSIIQQRCGVYRVDGVFVGFNQFSH